VSRARVVLPLAASALLAACAPSPDLSGWEIARKKNPGERAESYPEIPVRLPGSALPPLPTRNETPMQAVQQKALDEGSLFRRGFSAPTP
jgi:hypothetical protein